MVRRIVLMIVGVLLCVAGAASADPIALPSDEPLFIKFNNIELVDTCDPTCENDLVIPSDNPDYAGTQGNWGLVIISTIQHGEVATNNDLIAPDDGQPNIFTNTPGAGGAQITGIFYDIQLVNNNEATGGFLDLYWNEGTSLSISGSAPDATTVSAFTGGTFLARIFFTPGIFEKNFGGATCTTTIYSEAGVTAASGFADSYGNVDTTEPGPWSEVLDGNWFTNPCGGFSDIRFKNSFNLITEAGHAWFGDPANGILGFSSQDPAQVMTSGVIPEPATLTLIGVGLAGLGYRRRRRKV